MEAARETARQAALEGIKTAGEKDWRALAEWLKLTFPEHRSGNNINISATAAAQQNGLVCGEATRGSSRYTNGSRWPSAEPNNWRSRRPRQCLRLQLRHYRERQIVAVATFVVGLECRAASDDKTAIRKIIEAARDRRHARVADRD